MGRLGDGRGPVPRPFSLSTRVLACLRGRWGSDGDYGLWVTARPSAPIPRPHRLVPVVAVHIWGGRGVVRAGEPQDHGGSDQGDAPWTPTDAPAVLRSLVAGGRRCFASADGRLRLPPVPATAPSTPRGRGQGRSRAKCSSVKGSTSRDESRGCRSGSRGRPCSGWRPGRAWRCRARSRRGRPGRSLFLAPLDR